jgi:hypothetical protein
VARKLFKEEHWQFLYCLFVWWCGYYFARSTQHFTLLSNIWGFQFLLWIFLSLQWQNRKGLLGRGLILGLIFSGTFQNAPILFLPLVALLIHSLFNTDAKKYSWKLKTTGTAILVASSLVVFLPLYGPAIYAVLVGNYLKWSQISASSSLDLLAPFLPWKNNLIYDYFTQWPKLGIEASNPFDILILGVFIVSLFFWRFWRNSLRLTLLGIAIFSFWLSLGSGVRLQGELLFNNPGFDAISNILPFSLTRTPSRYALVTVLVMIFTGFQFLREKIHSKKVLNATFAGLLIWIVVTGPLLNKSFFVSHMNYAEFLPMKGLKQLKETPADGLVLNLPMAIAGDPTQNLMWLIHEHKINAGYLAYTAYTAKTMAPIEADPFLGKLACDGTLKFIRTSDLENSSWVQSKLQELHVQGLIFNKMYLKLPACQELGNWAQELSKKPWVKVLDENKSYIVLGFL